MITPGLSSVRSALAYMTLLSVLAATPASVQAQRSAANTPRYDRATETTVRGTVETVEQITAGGRGRRGLGGTHLVLRAGDSQLPVHLGPRAYLNENKIIVNKGDTVEIVGSRVTLAGEAVVLAKEIRVGTNVWTLRDAAGLPLWRGRGRGR